MKKIIYNSKQNVFSEWINKFFLNKNSKYIWPQICYDWNTGKLIHIVFEKNLKNKNYIKWPMKLDNINFTNLDFTSTPPKLENGKDWNFQSWHYKALKCSLAKNPEKIPISFWDWRLNTKPKGNATCDLDFLCKTKNNEYIGIEATEIYYLDESKNKNKDVFEHFQRLLKLRKGQNKGFNLKQLKAQMDFIKLFHGRMFMLFHEFIKDQGSYKLREDKSMLLEINQTNYNCIERIVNNNENHPEKTYSTNPMDILKKEFHFIPIQKIFDRFID